VTSRTQISVIRSHSESATVHCSHSAVSVFQQSSLFFSIKHVWIYVDQISGLVFSKPGALTEFKRPGTEFLIYAYWLTGLHKQHTA